MGYGPLRFKATKPALVVPSPRTLGQHLRKRRLQLGLGRGQAGELLAVTGPTVKHWETDQTTPHTTYTAAIIKFLGYYPFPEPTDVAGQLRAKRRVKGWSIRQAARALGVDPTTWGDWERGRAILLRAHRKLDARLLGLAEPHLSDVVAAKWAWSRTNRRKNSKG